MFTGYFRQYDYGQAENLKKYGQISPPDYDLKKVTAPGYLIYSDNDYLINTEIDFPKLYDNLGNCLGKYVIPNSQFQHTDFILGVSAPQVVYPVILKILKTNFI